MKKTKIYKYTSDEGAVITPINLKIGNPLVFFQLVAEGDKILTNGEKRIHVVNVSAEEIDLWQEVNKTEEEIERDKIPEAPEEETDYKELLDIITGADGAE